MLRDDRQVALDQLNKDMNDFLTLYHWLEENADAEVLVKRYEGPSTHTVRALSAVTAEIRDTGGLPSDADPDRQALEQLIIFLKSTLTVEQVDVMEGHLQTAMQRVRVALDQASLEQCREDTRSTLATLRCELEKYASSQGDRH